MIHIKDLTYIYQRGTVFEAPAIQDLSLDIMHGEIVGVLGSSGSGKSCLLRCLAGILTPVSGTIQIGGHNNNSSGNSRLGLVIQDAELQFFADTVFEEVAFALVNQGFPADQIVALVTEALNRVGFEGDYNQSPFRLSGGQQRRVAIASILVLKPDVLLLDEPTVGLDSQGLDSIRGLISEYRRGCSTLVIASHDLDFLYQAANRFLVLSQGKLVADFYRRDFGAYTNLLTTHGVGVPEMVLLKQRSLPEYLVDELNR